MELTEYMLNKQREMAQSIKDLLEQEIVNTTDEIRLTDIKTGVDYCNGAIVSCRLAAEILNQQKEAKKAEEAAVEPTTSLVDEKITADEAKPVPEDKPKKRSHHKKDKPPVEEPAAEEDITADLDDLF
ncbi:hypothetical protein [Megasphaera sueciensis]|uniref:hypothetical protein n=1 Tax=Megasphaera sueciensis TaxID=349094 RepID=UPI003CFDD843